MGKFSVLFLCVATVFLLTNGQRYFPQPSHYLPTNFSHPLYYPGYYNISNTTRYNSTYNQYYGNGTRRFWSSSSYYPPHYNVSGHNLFLGYPGYQDRLLFNQSIVKYPRWWSTREAIIEYPGYVPYGHIRNDTITAIRIYDQGNYGSDGYATIISGGIGYRYVKIRFYTQHWNSGFRFLVQVFGH